MLTQVEIQNFRIFKYINQPLNSFQILVGANASGKTTFLDTVNFVADIIDLGIDEAVFKRTSNYHDLTWKNLGGDIEIALEFKLPLEIQNKLEDNKAMDCLRYEIKIGIHEEKQELGILGERTLLLHQKNLAENIQQEKTQLMFPFYEEANHSVWNKKYRNTPKKTSKVIINKIPNGNDSFYPETYAKSSGGWIPSFKLGHRKSALANIPADDDKFPASNWLKEYLKDGIQLLMLNSLGIRQSSRPGLGKNFQNDGSNLPWVIETLEKHNHSLFKDWIRHLQTALPDIENITIHEIPDNKHKYLKIHYQNGIVVPSWMASDGTLRLLALTLIAYLPDFKGTYLIEEPENGIHPRAMETVFQSLSSIYDAQILLASHSSVFLGIARLSDLLCFAKTEEGIADIVKGENHPRLKNWKDDSNLSMLFAGGILG